MIFVDTGAWFACAVTEDINHAAAARWLDKNREMLLTTDYVVDETLTLFKSRGQPVTALRVGQQFFEGRVGVVHFLTEDQIRRTWEVFRQFADKEWSFTDCASKVVIEELEITQAFSFDGHFRQFGSVGVVP